MSRPKKPDLRPGCYRCGVIRTEENTYMRKPENTLKKYCKVCTSIRAYLDTPTETLLRRREEYISTLKVIDTVLNNRSYQPTGDKT